MTLRRVRIRTENKMQRDPRVAGRLYQNKSSETAINCVLNSGLCSVPQKIRHRAAD
jgi:hypothetical protein